MKNSIFLSIVVIFILLYFIISHRESFTNKYEINEPIITGANIASSKYDYPTANIANSKNLSCGMYTANSNYGDCICMVLSPSRIECHIKNFNKNIYGKRLKLNNLHKIKDTNDDLASIINLACDKIEF